MDAIDTVSLGRMLANPNPPLLVHVLPPEVFAARRIFKSVNACVYEASFLKRMAELAPDKGTPLVVYGAGAGSADAEVAAAKLIAAGYTHVRTYPEGFPGWVEAGYPLESLELLPLPERIDGSFALAAVDSVVRWTGRNLINHHSGTVRLSEGQVIFSGDALVSARFTIDMNTIACEDLGDAAINAMLIHHLHDADFFDVARYPTASFESQTSERLPASTEGTPNYLIEGAFTLRGVTNSMRVLAVIARNRDRVTAQAQLELDRTEFGSLYGSGRFFRFLGKHVVNDHVQLHIKLHADRTP